MVKNEPVAEPAPAPLAADALPLLFAANPMANEALLPEVADVVCEAVAPVVPPGVVCCTAAPLLLLLDVPLVVPAVRPMMAVWPCETDWLAEAELALAVVVPVPKVSEAAAAMPVRAKNATVARSSFFTG